MGVGLFSQQQQLDEREWPEVGPGEVQVVYYETFIFRNRINVLEQAAQGGVDALSLEVFNRHGDVVLRHVAHGQYWW